MYYQEEQTEICNGQSSLCFNCRKEILHVYEENERLQKENKALKKSLNEATDVIEQDKGANSTTVWKEFQYGSTPIRCLVQANQIQVSYFLGFPVF